MRCRIVKKTFASVCTVGLVPGTELLLALSARATLGLTKPGELLCRPGMRCQAAPSRPAVPLLAGALGAHYSASRSPSAFCSLVFGFGWVFDFFLTRGALCSPCPVWLLFPAPAAAVLHWWISLPFRCDLRTSEQALCQFCDLLPASKWRQEGIHFHQGDDSASVFLTIWREAPPAQKQSAEELRERIGRENKSRSK